MKSLEGGVEDTPFLPVAPASQGKRRKTSGGSSRNTVVAGTVKMMECGIDISIIAQVKPDGRSCTVCQVKDSDTDFVCAKIFMRWGHPPKLVITDTEQHYENDGNQCYYCVKPFKSRYKSRYKSMQAMISEFGRNEKGLAGLQEPPADHYQQDDQGRQV